MKYKNINYYFTKYKYNQGLNYIKNKQFQKALKVFNQVLKNYPNDLTIIELINTLKNNDIQLYDIYTIKNIYIFYKQDEISIKKIKEIANFIIESLKYINRNFRVKLYKDIIIVFDSKIKYAYANTTLRNFADRIRLNPEVNEIAILHELVHVLFSCKNRFFAEGIAVFFESIIERIKEKKNIEKFDFLQNTILFEERNKLIPIKKLLKEFDEDLYYFKNDFPDTEQQFLAYLEAGSLISYLIECYGIKYFIKFYKEIRNVTDLKHIELLIKQYFNLNINLLENEWKKNIINKITKSIQSDDKKYKKLNIYIRKILDSINNNKDIYINKEKAKKHIENDIVKLLYNYKVNDLIRIFLFIEKNDNQSYESLNAQYFSLIYFLNIVSIELKIQKKIINNEVIYNKEIEDIKNKLEMILNYYIKKLENKLQELKIKINQNQLSLIYYFLASLYNSSILYGTFIENLKKYKIFELYLEQSLKLDQENKYSRILQSIMLAFLPESKGGDFEKALEICFR